MPKTGGTFIQVESEIGAINMVLGASAAGVRAMTSSSGPGISLKQEGISYMAGSELPGVIVDIMRQGPGLGGIDASQADYWQATRGGGHGGYRIIVLAPASVQEMYDLTMLAFDLSDIYRMPAMVLADSVIGQMKESITANPRPVANCRPRIGLCAAGGKANRRMSSNPLSWVMARWRPFTGPCTPATRSWLKRRAAGRSIMTDDAELIVTAFGSTARIARTAVDMAREAGLKVGLMRPITLFPFPETGLSGTLAALQTFPGYRAFHRPDDR